MELEIFIKQEDTTVQYWNEVVFGELSNIYSKIYGSPMEFPPFTTVEDYSDQLKTRKQEEFAIVQYWNEHYPKFRFIDGKILLFRLSHSSMTLYDGFIANEFPPEEAIDVLNNLYNEDIVFQNKARKQAKQIEYLIIALLLTVTILAFLIFFN